MKSQSLWPAMWGAVLGGLVVVFAVYVTKQPVCLWGLVLVICLVSHLKPESDFPDHPDNYRTRCPKCDCRFLAEQLDDDDEE